MKFGIKDFEGVITLSLEEISSIKEGKLDLTGKIVKAAPTQVYLEQQAEKRLIAVQSRLLLLRLKDLRVFKGLSADEKMTLRDHVVEFVRKNPSAEETLRFIQRVKAHCTPKENRFSGETL